jgi:hypothetical protein
MADNASTKVIEFPVGDYGDRLDRAYAAAMDALNSESAATMLEGDAYTELRAEYDALAAESKEASRAAGLYVVLREVSRKDWRKIKADHPPRTEGSEDAVKGDRIAGFNTDEAEDDLVFAALVEPKFTTRAAFDEWADNLGAGKFAAVAEQAYLFTVGARVNPKSLPASPTRSES